MADKKVPEIDELNQLYEDGCKVDDELFAEMRSNILLVSGSHYNKRTSQTFFTRVRNSAKLSDTQKLRITQNHIHKITRKYIDSILNRVPGVTVSPQNEMEMSDRKAAELNQAVWADAKERYKLSEKRREWAHNFVEIGEVACFVYYDPEKGAIKGYEQLVDQNGTPVVDEAGAPVADETKPVFEGEFCFKTILGFNFIRSGSARQMRESPVVMFREMVDTKELELTYQDVPEKLKMIKGDGQEEEYIIFDHQKQRYETTKQTLLRYHFFRPCKQYPQGYFTISTNKGKLEEGELPFGIWPIAWKGFDEFASNPRGYSIVKVARPMQAEINRALSQQATHQITVGDDKIIYQSGTKLAPGALLPGVRGLTFQGAPPQILPGRDGSQFLPYIESQVQSMYRAVNLEELLQDEPTGQMDPYTLLFRSASQAQKFGRYTEKFEEFLKEVCEIYLALAKKYLDNDAFIRAVGKSEIINIPEFRNTLPLSYTIKVEPQSETVDSKLGRQLSLNHVLQYVGNQIGPKQIGLVLKEMPFLNNKTLFKTLSVDYDNVENDMLALERGEVPQVSQYSDNTVYVNALTHRMKQADFKILSPQIQANYINLLKQHEAILEQKAEAEKAAQSGFIPTGGAMITCSMKVPNPADPTKQKQLILPYESLSWLMKRLESQGTGQEQIEDMNTGAKLDMMKAMMERGIVGSPGQSEQMAQPQGFTGLSSPQLMQ